MKQADVDRLELHENKFSYSFPHIVSVKGKFEEDAQICFVLQYIDGVTLKDFLKKKGKLAIDLVRAIAVQIILSLEYVH